jgi:outer membrane lipoprotein
MKKLSLYLFCALLIIGCAGKRFDTANVDATVTPDALTREPQRAADQHVLWGGIILDTRNLEGSTQIEALSYPLASNQRPDTDGSPQGRFLIRYPGYLEPLSYAQGRKITVLGQLGEMHKGRVGESEYLYPQVNAERIELWQDYEGPRTTFHLGIGIVR